MRLCRGFLLVVTTLILVGCATVVPPPSNPPSTLDRSTDSYRSPSDAPRILDVLERQMAERQKTPSDLSPSDLAIYSNLLLAAGRLADAEKAFAILDQRRPGDRAVLMSLALLAGVRGDTKAQDLRVTALEKAFPGDLDAADLRARLLLAEGDQAGARAVWTAILSKREDTKALTALTDLDLDAKHPQDALPYAQRAVKRDPGDDQVLALRARVLNVLGRYTEARLDLDRAVALAPDDPWHHLERGELAWLHLDDPALAQADLEFAAIKMPDNFFAWSALAAVYEDQREPRRAYDAWLKALSLRPDDRSAYPSVAILAFRYQDFARAVTYSKEAAKDYPAEYAFPFVEALSLRALGQPQQGQFALEKARPRFDRESTVDEMFRFLLTPGSDYAFNTVLNQEKKETVRVRLRFYQGCYYALTRSPASAKAAFDEVAGSTLLKIPEIDAARDWSDHGL